MTEAYELPVILERDGTGPITATCPIVPGCYTEGATEEEAIANIREAITAHITARRARGEEIPLGHEFKTDTVTITI